MGRDVFVVVAATASIAACSFAPSDATSSGGRDGGGGDVGNHGDASAIDSPASDGAGACTALPPSVNVDVTAFSFTSAPAWTCSGSGTTTIDSSGTGAISSPCGDTPAFATGVAQLAGGASVMVVPLRSLTVTDNHTLRLTGSAPIVLLVGGDVLVDSSGSIDAGATGAAPGPGGSLASVCTSQAQGLALGGTNQPGWGGGGGGFGTAGGQGGMSTINGGFAVAGQTLEPLRGGCSGMTGGGAPAGGGGGAFEISAAGTITIGSTGPAALLASGGGAPSCTDSGGDVGGNGGGAGGGILLVAPTQPAFGSGGVARAHGGAGGQGMTGNGTGDAGEDGHVSDDDAATDTSGTPGGGDGDDHGRVGGLARYSSAGTLAVAGQATTMQGGGRGGGGGGGGVIVVTTAPATACP
jgi:hypothetical protein